jgi:hypothetical protein
LLDVITRIHLHKLWYKTYLPVKISNMSTILWMWQKETVLIYKYSKFHACSINRTFFTDFLNELCSRVKFTFCAHMKQIPLLKGSFSFLQHIINTFHHISNISYYPRRYWQKNTQITICKISLFLRLLYTCLDNLYTIELVISGIASIQFGHAMQIWNNHYSFL